MAIHFKAYIWQVDADLPGRARAGRAASFNHARAYSAEAKLLAAKAGRSWPTLISSGLIKLLLVAACLLLPLQQSQANNIAVTNVTYTDLSNGTADIQFDLSWDNSWRTSSNAANWDAAWVFLKYRINPTNSPPWLHVIFMTNNYSAPSGSTIDVITNGVGAFIYRSSAGSGNNNFAGVTFRWDNSETDIKPDDDVLVQVFAIEMVYIPTGSFYVGDGASDNNQFRDGTNGLPFQITSEDEMILGGTNAGNLSSWPGKDDFNDATLVTNPAAFPKGFNAFYCMKYELCQGQYADFLSKLTSTQCANRYNVDKLGSYRYSISGTWPNMTAGAPERACNYISWPDCLAYSDWAGLRPMTELELEKACRGTNYPVINEFAWGTTNYNTAVYFVTNVNFSTEIVTNPATGKGNASYASTCGGFGGSYRCGIFAGSITNPTREEAGASFYGVMNMSGNIWEGPLPIGNTVTRAFTGLHGDGDLTAAGAANVSNWPDGAAVRGSYFIHPAAASMRISDRRDCNYGAFSREYNRGFRSVRTAP